MDSDDETSEGMIPRTIRKIFQEMENLKEKVGMGSVDTMEASFLEIYNEEIRDLLATDKDKKDVKYEIKMLAGSKDNASANNGSKVSDDARFQQQTCQLSVFYGTVYVNSSFDQFGQFIGSGFNYS